MFTCTNATDVVPQANALQSNLVEDFDLVGGDFVVVASIVGDIDGVRVMDLERDSVSVGCNNSVVLRCAVGVGESLC